MSNAINWFEIPAVNLARAVKFYSDMLDAELPLVENDYGKMAFLPYDQKKGVGGCLVSGNGHKPSAEGSMVYLNGGKDLAGPLSRVEKAGGKVLMPKTKVSDEVGYMAIFIDTEGNRVALHSPPSV